MEDVEETQETSKEETKAETQTKGDATKTDGVGAQVEEKTPIEKAEDILKRIAVGLAKSEAVAKRMEEASARMLMGGKGVVTHQKTPEDVEKEEINKQIQEALTRFK